jgi:mercuric ion binding protein
MKYILILAVVILAILSACKKPEPQPDTAIIQAKSMVCGTCVSTITKAVNKVEGVKGVEVDLKAKTVQVKYMPGQTDLKTIETAISNAGYDANDRKRDPDAYAKLPSCCKIDG